MDHLGPFIPTARKNTHLLVTVDAFTKYTWLWPVKTTAAQHVISFLDQLIGTYGVPRRIIADCGPAFTSNQFKGYCHDKGIRLVLTAVSTPRAAGQVERVNSIVLDKLIAILPDERTWDKYLDQVKMSISNQISETTRMSQPNQLFFGFRPRRYKRRRILSAQNRRRVK
jgi:transposase InsO family protein